MQDFKKILVNFIILFLVLPIKLYAEENVMGFLFPKSNKFNSRAGPSLRYPIKYTYIKKGIAFKVLDQFDDWIFLQDIEGDSGWAQRNLFSGAGRSRNVFVQNKNRIECYKNPTKGKKEVVFIASYLVKFQLMQCRDSYCLLKREGLKGWCPKESLWGLP